MTRILYRLGFIIPVMMMAGCSPSGVNSASAAHACNVAINASMAGQDIANVLVARGIEAGAAAKIAQAIRTFQLTAEMACALVKA